MRQLMTGACLFFFNYTALDLSFLSERIIVETDAVAIASRVSRPRADASDMVINEQTLMNAYSNIRDKVQKQISQMQ